MLREGGSASWPFTGRRAEVDAFAEARTDPDCVGLVAVGVSGVGTTRLVQECADRAASAGVEVLRCWATAASQSSSLTALLPVFPADALAPGPSDLSEVVRRVREHLGGDGHDPTMLVVDQLHLLDDASATVVDRLLHSGSAFLLASVTQGVTASEAVTSLWTSGRVRRLDLEPLPRATVDTLLHRALGSGVDGAAAADLWTASEGNPLLLHELVDAAVANGSLAEVDGVWRTSGRLEVTGRAAELIERRLVALGPAASEALEIVAVNQSIGLTDLERFVDVDVLEALETGGFVAIEADRRRTEVVIAHPAVADVVTRNLSTLRARRLALAAVERVQVHGCRRFDDVLRIAQWLLDATGSAPPDTLLAAVRVARGTHDFATVERLARVAVADEGGAAATQLLGEALYELGQFVEAEATLAHPTVTPATDEERDLLASTRATNLFWGLADPAGSLAVIDAAAEAATSPQAIHALLAQRCSVILFSGNPGRALAELPELDQDDKRARVESALVASPAQALAGHTAEAIAIAEQAFGEHLELGDVSAIAHPGSHMVSKVVALTEAGRLAEAWELGRLGYDLAVSERVAVAKMWFALALGRSSLLRGSPALASRWFREQVVHARSLDHRQPLRFGLAGVAISAAYLGDTDAAEFAVAELDGFQGPAYGLFEVEVVRARVWTLAALGRTQEGRELLLPAADEALASGQLTQEGIALHEYVRLGGAPSEVVARLVARADATDSALLQACAHHVQGLADDDGAALAAAADGFEVVGAVLHAAEAATAAGDAFRRQGEQRLANAQSNRASTLIGSCEGATTPALVITSTAVPLTAREREVAYLVARGLQSKDIAEQLFLSVRTVNNHLQRVYGKLGVTSRAEVGPALSGAEAGRR